MPYVDPPTWDATINPATIAGYSSMRRTSKVWPSPTVEPFTGRVTNWDYPEEISSEQIGYLQVRVNGIDMTWLEAGDGGPLTVTQVLSWESAEPFDDASCVLNFPTIWPWDSSADLLLDGCDVDLIWKHPTAADRVIFEGKFVSEESTLLPGMAIHCIGALYELDLFVEPPPTSRRERKVNDAIADLFTDSRRYTRITAPYGYAQVQSATVDVNHVVTYTDVTTDRMGSFDSALTGAADGLLQFANTYSAGTPWTLMKRPGRIAEIRRKSMPVSDEVDWTVAAGAPGINADLTRDLLSAPTAIFAAGTAPDGCRWRNMKFPAYTAAATAADERDTTDRARILPVYEKLTTRAWNYSSDGTIEGPNPFFDPTIMQVERFVAAGERMPLATFANAASLEILNNWPAGYRGSITLTDDPEEGSRFWIKAGQNIRLKYFRGSGDGKIFHISRCSVDFQSGTVTLTVDQDANDVSATDALIERVRDANDASRRGLRNQRRSQAVADNYAAWDCESGSGRVPPFAVSAATWTVKRIAAAELGTIVRTRFEASTPTRFTAGLFGYHVSATLLTAAGNPLEGLDGFWQNWTADETKRPVVPWGGKLVDGTTESAGFYPGLETDGATVTGIFQDDGNWAFESKDPPWLWLAVWCESACTFRGGWSSDDADDNYTALRIAIDTA